MRGYFNGEQAIAAIPAGNFIQLNSGLRIAVAARNRKALIDEVVIVNRTLADKEVKQIYAARSSRHRR